MKFQEAFQNTMQALEHDSNDMTLTFEVRQYAKTVFMVMQAQNALIEYQEQEEVEALIESFNQ